MGSGIQPSGDFVRDSFWLGGSAKLGGGEIRKRAKTQGVALHRRLTKTVYFICYRLLAPRYHPRCNPAQLRGAVTVLVHRTSRVYSTVPPRTIPQPGNVDEMYPPPRAGAQKTTTLSPTWTTHSWRALLPMQK